MRQYSCKKQTTTKNKNKNQQLSNDSVWSDPLSRQILTSLSDIVLCPIKVALARFQSDTTYRQARFFRHKPLHDSDLKVCVSWCWLFPRLQGFLENVRPFIPRLRFFFFFCKVEISKRTLIPLFRPGSVHSGSASGDDCDRCSVKNCA